MYYHNTIRTLPNITLKSLRDELSQQLDRSLFPSSYVFLRSVGKCLTLVSMPDCLLLLYNRHFYDNIIYINYYNYISLALITFLPRVTGGIVCDASSATVLIE